MFLTVIDLFLMTITLFLIAKTLISPPDVNRDNASVRVGNKSLNILYTNADKFLNKRDLLSVQIIRQPTPDIILISEMLPKAPNAVLNLSLFALPGYLLYLNFDPDNYNSIAQTHVE